MFSVVIQTGGIYPFLDSQQGDIWDYDRAGFAALKQTDFVTVHLPGVGAPLGGSLRPMYLKVSWLTPVPPSYSVTLSDGSKNEMLSGLTQSDYNAIKKLLPTAGWTTWTVDQQKGTEGS